MNFKMVKAIRVKALPAHRLEVVFSDGSGGVADLADFVFAGGEMVEPLKDEAYFARVFIEMGVPTWPNGCDFDAINMRMRMEAAGALHPMDAAV